MLDCLLRGRSRRGILDTVSRPQPSMIIVIFNQVYKSISLKGIQNFITQALYTSSMCECVRQVASLQILFVPLFTSIVTCVQPPCTMKARMRWTGAGRRLSAESTESSLTMVGCSSQRECFLKVHLVENRWSTMNALSRTMGVRMPTSN